MTPEQISALPYRPNVGIMLVNGDSKVFAAQRLDSTFDAWQMPQGGIDEGEDPRKAALRELEEETGVPPELVSVLAESADWLTYDLPHDLVPQIWKGRYRGQKQRWYLMRFLGKDDQIDIATEHPEFSRWAWVDPSELVDRIVPFKRDVYARVLSEFADHLR
jgi:putative (di)nucleoside polyphosphate hydrolase